MCRRSSIQVLLLAGSVFVLSRDASGQSWELIQPQIRPARVMGISVRPMDGDKIVVATDPDGGWFYNPLLGAQKLEFASIHENFGYSIHLWGVAHAPSNQDVVYMGGKL